MANKRVEKKVGFIERLKRGIKFTDSYTSLILGAIVVVVAVALLFTFLRMNRSTDTSSTDQTPETSQENTSSTYTIKPGDDLWSISESVYKDGYKWVEIARLNNLENPDIIYAGNKLTLAPLPQTTETELATSEGQTTASSEITQNTEEQTNNAISGNTYTVKSGDHLWDIAVRTYGDGYKWVEIARANNLDNPEIIHTGNVLQLPR